MAAACWLVAVSLAGSLDDVISAAALAAAVAGETTAAIPLRSLQQSARLLHQEVLAERVVLE